MKYDDWITKLYITEILNNQMKYTDQGLVQTIQTNKFPIFKLYKGNELIPDTVQFELELLANNLGSTIQGVNILVWFDQLFDRKVITSVEHNTPEVIEFLSKLNMDAESLLFVEQWNDGYLLTTMFNIVSKLLDGDDKLISIKLI